MKELKNALRKEENPEGSVGRNSKQSPTLDYFSSSAESDSVTVTPLHGNDVIPVLRTVTEVDLSG